jgi:glycosyltransferase involved in cell wall biosynthesis
MRVLLISNGPADEDQALVLARRQVPLLHELRLRGVEPIVALCGDGGRLADRLRRESIDVRLVSTPLPPSATALRMLPRTVWELRRIIRSTAPDVVEGDEPMPAIAAGLASLPVPRARVVVYRRHHHGGRMRLHLASRLASRLTDATMVSCETMRQYAAKVDRVSLERIELTTSGGVDPFADVDATDPRAELAIPAGTPILTVVSQLRRQKGIDVFLAALEHVEADVHAVIVGAGPEERALRRLAARSLLPVHFLGHRRDATRWLAAATVVVMPSREESFGRVAVETMAAGRPLIGTAVGGLIDAIADGETGIVVPPENPKALAEAIDALLADRGRAEEMGRKARQRFEGQYTIAKMAQSWTDGWQRVLRAKAERLR